MKHHAPEHFKETARQLTARRGDTFDYFVRHGVLARSTQEFAYRDHRFQVRSFGPGWRVFIYTPGSGVLFKDVPRSLKPDSRDAVIQEAKEIVDQRIRANRLALRCYQARAEKSAPLQERLYHAIGRPEKHSDLGEHSNAKSQTT
jgi:hypothetical protein